MTALMRVREKRLPLVADGAHVYRTRLTWRTSWFFACLYVVICGGAVIAYANVDTPGSSSRRLALIVGALVVGAFEAFFAARTATAGVFADEAGIRIRNP